MPTYEYRCPNGHEFDKFQQMSDRAEATCPECGADAERLISAGAGLVFKGSGFYITENRTEGYKNAAKKEQGGGDGESGKKDGKSKESSGESGGSKKSGGSKSTDSAE